MDKLYKDETNGIWMGVLLGLSEYFNVDVAVVRVVYCLLTLATGVVPGILFYGIMALCIPNNPANARRQQALNILRSINRK